MNNFVEDKLKELSSVMEVEVQFGESQGDQGRVMPVFNVNGIISKMLALFVFSGLHVPHSFPPSFNSVHADIEFWKQRIKEAADGVQKP